MHPFFQDYSFFGFVHRGGDEVEKGGRGVEIKEDMKVNEGDDEATSVTSVTTATAVVVWCQKR